jgi:hypothetical protein
MQDTYGHSEKEWHGFGIVGPCGGMGEGALGCVVYQMAK